MLFVSIIIAIYFLLGQKVVFLFFDEACHEKIFAFVHETDNFEYVDKFVDKAQSLIREALLVGPGIFTIIYNKSNE